YAARHGYPTYILQHHLQAVEVASTKSQLDKNDPLVLRLLALLTTMDGETLWGLMPALCSSPVLPFVGENVRWLRSLVQAPRSVFSYASLPDPVANRALQYMLLMARSWGAPGYDIAEHFVAPLE